MNTEDFNKLPKELREKIIGMAHSIERVFGTQEGQKVLEHWKKEYLMVPYSKPELTQDERMYNAGKAALILEIIESIKLSKEVR